jgi:hypothetical protein
MVIQIAQALDQAQARGRQFTHIRDKMSVSHTTTSIVEFV